MAGNLLPEPKQQFLDAIGAPLFAGRIFTYEAGSLTPKPTYQDSAMTILNTNPVILDARGESVMYGDGIYRVILKDLFGNTIWDRDNIETPGYSSGQFQGSLSSALGAGLVGYGSGTSQDALDGARPLTYYGTNQAALLALLTYAKTTGKPICLNRNVTLTSDLNIDLGGARFNFDFGGYAVYTDSFRLGILNPGQDSFINRPDMRVITPPWVISRWGADGNWLPEASILGTLTQTLAPGYYQPSVNDGSVYAALTPAQQNQNISALLYVYGANGLIVQSPRGLYCLYEFNMCNRTEVVDPQILCGGKGTYGTILFKNLETVGYGVGNYVTGGFVHYGSFSGVCFMRNRMGGASTLSPYRTGESGVKFYQNEVSGRSARCYNMKMLDIDSHQTVYDGHDYNSDFGSPAERVDDYTLAQFPWNQLPTGHVISNVRAVDCQGVGIWGDGQFNQYSTLHAERCFKDGIYLRTTNSEIDDPFVFDCNRAGGHHQITCEGEGNRINSPKTHTTSIVTGGFAIYCTGSTTVTNDEKCTGTRIEKQINRADRSSNNIKLGTRDITQSNVRVFGQPREDLLNNPCGEIRFVLTGAVPSNEEGLVGVFAYSGGVPAQRGILAMPGQGGHSQMGAQNTFNGPLLNVGYASFYEQGGVLRVGYKKLDGTIVTYGLTA